jgi:hypothetical protein
MLEQLNHILRKLRTLTVQKLSSDNFICANRPVNSKFEFCLSRKSRIFDIISEMSGVVLVINIIRIRSFVYRSEQFVLQNHIFRIKITQKNFEIKFSDSIQLIFIRQLTLVNSVNHHYGVICY